MTEQAQARPDDGEWSREYDGPVGEVLPELPAYARRMGELNATLRARIGELEAEVARLHRNAGRCCADLDAVLATAERDAAEAREAVLRTTVAALIEQYVLNGEGFLAQEDGWRFVRDLRAALSTTAEGGAP